MVKSAPNACGRTALPRLSNFALNRWLEYTPQDVHHSLWLAFYYLFKPFWTIVVIWPSLCEIDQLDQSGNQQQFWHKCPPASSWRHRCSSASQRWSDAAWAMKKDYAKSIKKSDHFPATKKQRNSFTHSEDSTSSSVLPNLFWIAPCQEQTEWKCVAYEVLIRSYI